MAVLIVLFGSMLIFRGLGSLGIGAFSNWQDCTAYALTVMFLFTASAHFNKMRHDLVRMVPAIFPSPMLMIHATGILEILGAVGLAIPRFRSIAGFCLILLLLVLFPANIKAARENLTLRGKPATQLWLRAPMQILFIGLIWWVSRPLGWF